MSTFIASDEAIMNHPIYPFFYIGKDNGSMDALEKFF